MRCISRLLVCLLYLSCHGLRMQTKARDLHRINSTTQKLLSAHSLAELSHQQLNRSSGALKPVRTLAPWLLALSSATAFNPPGALAHRRLPLTSGSRSHRVPGHPWFPVTMTAELGLPDPSGSKGGQQDASNASSHAAVLAGLQSATLQERVGKFGKDHPETLSSKNALASTLWDLGKVQAAQELQQEVLDSIRRTLGESDPDALASVLLEGLQKSILDSSERILGPEHPDTLASKAEVARILFRRGDLKGAEKLQREVLDLGETDSQDIHSSKDALATTLRCLGCNDEAERLWREVLVSRTRTLALGDPETLQINRKLLLLMQDRGNLSDAEGLQKDVYEDLKAQGNPLPDCREPTQTLSRAARLWNKIIITVVKGAVDIIYKDRNVQRFYVLETVARVPYFAYVSCLNLYETFGKRGNTRRLRAHYAQSDNELHHLLIMEELGGNDKFIDRFIATSLAFCYYWYSVASFLLSPQAAYNLGQLIEEHAYRTYDKFLKDNAKELQKRPVPNIAREYYSGRDAVEAYLRTEQRQNATNVPRQLNSLYDVFVEIRGDEAAHWRSLKNLAEFGDLDALDGCPLP